MFDDKQSMISQSVDTGINHDGHTAQTQNMAVDIGAFKPFKKSMKPREYMTENDNHSNMDKDVGVEVSAKST